MKKIIGKLLVIFFLISLPAFAYEDSDVIAHNYNQQGLLALKHAKESKGLQKKMYLKEAKWFYQHSVDIYPDNFDGFLGLARTYMYMGRFDKAYNNMMIAFNFDKNNLSLFDIYDYVLLSDGSKYGWNYQKMKKRKKQKKALTKKQHTHFLRVLFH